MTVSSSSEDISTDWSVVVVGVLLVEVATESELVAVLVEISDNGKGFDQVETQKKNSLGLKTRSGFFLSRSFN